MRLQQRDDLGQALVTPVLQRAQHAGLEEHLRVAQAVVVLVKHFVLDQLSEYLVSHLLAIAEALWDGIRSQDGVSVRGGTNKCITER